MAAFFGNIWENILTFFKMIFAAFADIRFVDILDIALVSFIIYKALRFFRETRAKPLIKGILLLFFIWLIALWWDMVSMKWLMSKVFDYAIIAVAIVFQPELRRALERMGGSKIGLFGRGGSLGEEDTLRLIETVSSAAQTMQQQKVGALIVFERSTPLGEIIATGTVVDAAPTEPLICNIFYPKSPLHDGAMIIRGNRVHAAGCILPLTAGTDLSRQLGTRHRAAVGMSENSDAAVLVVSEETGAISIAENGTLTQNYSGPGLRAALRSLLVEEEEIKNTGIIAKVKRFFARKKDGRRGEESPDGAGSE